MSESIMKYRELMECSIVAAKMVAYFANKQNRPLTERERWERDFHNRNAARHSSMVRVLESQNA